MIRAGAGVSTRAEPRAALDEAVVAALAGAGRADAALLFAGPGFGEDLAPLLDAACAALETTCLVGASAHGLLGTGRDCEGEAAIGVLALSGVEAETFLLSDAGGGPASVADELAERLSGPGGPGDLVVVLPDPRSLDAGELLAGLARVLGPVSVVGAGAGDPLAGAPLQWCGRALASGGVSGMRLRLGAPPRIGVTQACRPRTELLTVTRARGHWILELDGRPALEVFREVARGPLAQDLRRAAQTVLVALPAGPCGESLEPGDYLVRHVVGFETDANAFAIPQPVRPGDRLALACREPEAARADLKAMLAGLAGAAPAAALYFDCCARGAGFFGVRGLEAGYLEQALGPAPLLGMLGSCELGPVGGRTELLTYTGVLALIDP